MSPEAKENSDFESTGSPYLFLCISFDTAYNIDSTISIIIKRFIRNCSAGNVWRSKPIHPQDSFYFLMSQEFLFYFIYSYFNLKGVELVNTVDVVSLRNTSQAAD